MGGMGMMGMGMGMNRMGMGGMNGGGWFGNDTASLDQIMYMMNMNSWFFDQLSDQAMSMWMRLRDMLLWLYRMKNWVIRGDYRQATEIAFESEDERQEWERKLLKRIYCVGACACVFAMWTFRRMFTRRQQRARWNHIFGNGPQRGLPGPLRPSL
jgi:hypothetical protein